MPWSILNRYIIGELVRIFALTQVAISGIFLMAFVVQEASQQGCGPVQLFYLIPLMIPWTLPYTVPATTLFAVACVYGRLSQDNEITAIKAAGIPVRTVIWPAVWIGAILSAVMLFLYSAFIPTTLHQMKTVIRNNVEDFIYSLLERDLAFNQPNVNYAIWVQDVQGRRLIKPYFIQRDNAGRDVMVAHAREAEIDVDLEENIIKLHMLHADWTIPKPDGESSGHVEKRTFEMALPEGLAGHDRKLRCREMTTWSLLSKRAALVKTRAETATALEAAPGDDPKDKQLLSQLKSQHVQAEKDIWSIDTEFAMRPTLSLGCLCFVLIGCPVAIWFHKGDYLSVFVTCFLPLVLTYYPLTMMGVNLGKTGRVEPMIVLLGIDVVLAAVGVMLYARLVRR